MMLYSMRESLPQSSFWRLMDDPLLFRKIHPVASPIGCVSDAIRKHAPVRFGNRHMAAMRSALSGSNANCGIQKAFRGRLHTCIL